MLDGIGYASKKFRARFEKETDRITIDHGLGWQIHNFTDLAVNQLRVTRKYREYKKDIYMQPEAIVEYIQEQKP